MKVHCRNAPNRGSTHKVRSRHQRRMQVTEEDGGRLNAFAKEPRMEVIDDQSSRSNSSRMMIIVGGALVVALMAVTVAIS